MYESYSESNTSARSGSPTFPAGGGIRSTIASSSCGIPCPVFADTYKISSRSNPIRSTSSDATASGRATGRSILFTTGISARSCSSARYTFASVCAWIPSAASTTSSAPSAAARLRDTS